MGTAMRKMFAAASVMVTAAALLTGQSEQSFTVVAIKPVAQQPQGVAAAALPGGGFWAEGANVTFLLGRAFGVSRSRIVGAPKWTETEYFDIDARYEAASKNAPIPDSAPMMRALLRDRFALDAAIEKRDIPIYALRLARSDGRLGRGLKRSALNCTNASEAGRKYRENGVTGSSGQPPCALRTAPGRLIAGGARIRMLSAFIVADREVHDQTGLDGFYDITLMWENGDDPIANQAAVLTALRDELVLKLEPAVARVDVLVVKSIRRPTPN